MNTAAIEDFKNMLMENEDMRNVLESQEYAQSRLVFKKRMELGLTQNQLAKSAKVTQKSISRIEGADPGVRRSTLMRVAKVLNINGFHDTTHPNNCRKTKNL